MLIISYTHLLDRQYNTCICYIILQASYKSADCAVTTSVLLHYPFSHIVDSFSKLSTPSARFSQHIKTPIHKSKYTADVSHPITFSSNKLSVYQILTDKHSTPDTYVRGSLLTRAPHANSSAKQSHAHFRQ